MAAIHHPPHPGPRCCAKPLEHSFSLLSHASVVARGCECLHCGSSSSVPTAMMFPLSPQGLPQLFLLPSTLLRVIRLCHHPLAQGHTAGQGFADSDTLGPLYLSRLCQPCSIPFQGETHDGTRTGCINSGCNKALFQCQASGREALPAREAQPALPNTLGHLKASALGTQAKVFTWRCSHLDLSFPCILMAGPLLKCLSVHLSNT